MLQQATSIYTVTDYKTGNSFREFIEGDGQKAIGFLRREYPRFTKFVLEGFEVNGNFIPLVTETK